MPRAKGRRPARSAVVRRWLAVGALVLVGLLYYRPLKAYVDARGELAQKHHVVQGLKAERQRLRHRLGSSTSLDTLGREARALGYVRPGEHLFIVKGINEWRSASGPARWPTVDADRAVVAQQLGREPRAFRRVAVRCPFGRPAVTEQSPYSPDGEPFPTTYYVTCRHLVAAISRLEADSGVERWTRAAAEDPALAASRARADDDQRRSAARSPVARPVATTAPRSSSASAEPAGRGRSSACTLMSHSRSRTPATRSASESSPRSSRSGPTTAARAATTASIPARCPSDATTLVRHEWEEGARKLEAERGDPHATSGCSSRLSRRGRAAKQVGQTYTLDELAAAYRDAERWARAAVEERAPSAGWPRDLALVLAAAFHAYERGALDYLS